MRNPIEIVSVSRKAGKAACPKPWVSFLTFHNANSDDNRIGTDRKLHPEVSVAA